MPFGCITEDLPTLSAESQIDKLRRADLPGGLVESVEEFFAAAAALRPHYPPESLYRVEFGESTLLREVLEPEEHNSHWWQTGLYIISDGIANHPALNEEYGLALSSLYTQLTAYLGPYDAVSLREIDAKTVTGICLLSEFMQYPQNTFVSPNSYSLAQALFSPNAWYRAIYAGKAPVGFVMLDDDAEKQKYYLWRFMIAPHFQSRGFGTKAIEAVIEHVKTRPGATELLLHYVDHEQGAAEFYRGLGFSETGEVDEDEVEMRLTF